MDQINAANHLRNIASSISIPQTAPDILSRSDYSQPRADTLRAMGRINHRLSDLIQCEQIVDFLHEKPSGPDAFNRMCTFLDGNQFSLDEAMDIAKAIQTEDSTFLITAEINLESDLAMFHDRIAVIDALVQRDMVFTLWGFEDTPVECLQAITNLLKDFIKANSPRCPQVSGLIVAEVDDHPEEDQVKAWSDLTAYCDEVRDIQFL